MSPVSRIRKISFEIPVLGKGRILPFPGKCFQFSSEIIASCAFILNLHRNVSNFGSNSHFHFYGKFWSILKLSDKMSYNFGVL